MVEQKLFRVQQRPEEVLAGALAIRGGGERHDAGAALLGRREARERFEVQLVDDPARGHVGREQRRHAAVLCRELLVDPGAVHQVQHLGELTQDWPSLASVGVVESQRQVVGGKTSTERRYFISSLSGTDARRFGQFYREPVSRYQGSQSDLIRVAQASACVL